MDIEIKNFVDCKSSLPTIAVWLHAEFFSDKPEFTEAVLLESMYSGKRDDLPLGLASFEGGVPTGTLSILEQDLGRSSELSPWIAGVYVDPPHRGKGIGKALVESGVKEARRLGFESVYLFTDSFIL